jgi:uncharacterized protein
MELQSLKIELPANTQIILAQSHFIKTVEDVSECLVNCVSNIKYGVAFCEASGPCLVRHAGNDSSLELLATDYAFKLSVGHSLIILIQEAFPINKSRTNSFLSNNFNVICCFFIQNIVMRVGKGAFLI